MNKSEDLSHTCVCLEGGMSARVCLCAPLYTCVLAPCVRVRVCACVCEMEAGQSQGGSEGGSATHFSTPRKRCAMANLPPPSP